MTALFDGVVAECKVHPRVLVNTKAKDNPVFARKRLACLRSQVSMPVTVVADIPKRNDVSSF
ncbi:MAG: hypothetical protein HYU71_02780 [Bacteroidetes bacterium]|nr:hypothetical protein [Bacteroidota bacterium]